MLIQTVLQSLSELEREEALNFFPPICHCFPYISTESHTHTHTHTTYLQAPDRDIFKSDHVTIMLKFLQCYLNVLSHIKITKAKFLFYSFCSFFKHKRNHALCIYTWTLLHATCFACFTLFLEKFSMSIYS